jgi:hypothetical protein
MFLWQLLLVLLFLFFMQQFHEMAKDSWTNRMHGVSVVN